MAHKVIMPALGMSMETGIILEWLKQEGDAVAVGDILLEIETDKATAELEAEADGVLRGVSAAVNDEVPVGVTIAWILAEGEALPEEATPSQPVSAPAAEVSEAPQPENTYNVTPVARRVAQENQVNLDVVEASDGKRISKADVLAHLESNQNGAVKLVAASPLARRIAQENGLTIETINGSGPEGAVIFEDVQTVLKQATAQPVPTQVAATDEANVIPMSRAWATTAKRLAEAWQTIPHFYLRRKVDVTDFMAWRKVALQHAEEKITYTDLLTKCVAMALKKHPRVNAYWLNNQIVANAQISVGLAVATEDGLIVPVIHETDKLSLEEIAIARKGVVTRAQSGKLKPQDLQGGTFSISNLGMYKVDEFDAIVNPPQVAILAVGNMVEEVVPVDGQPQIRAMMTLNLSLDHRAVDGARGAQFLDTLVGYIQQPLSIL